MVALIRREVALSPRGDVVRDVVLQPLIGRLGTVAACPIVQEGSVTIAGSKHILEVLFGLLEDLVAVLHSVEISCIKEKSSFALGRHPTPHLRASR